MANNLGAKVSVSIEGLNALRLALQNLPEEVQTKVLASATAKGGRQMLAAIRAETRRKFVKGYSTGLISKSLRSTRGVRRVYETSAFVGIRPLSKTAVRRFIKATGKKSSLNPVDPYYWKVLEFGKSDRTAHPFLRPGFNSNKERVAQSMARQIKVGVQNAIRKLRIQRGAK